MIGTVGQKMFNMIIVIVMVEVGMVEGVNLIWDMDIWNG
jgi:hypothetical protein